MSSQEPVEENVVSTERNGESAEEESPANGAEPEPPKLPDESPLEQAEAIATDGAEPEKCPVDDDVPQDKKDDAPLDAEDEEDDRESVPEDLNDFIVLDEAEITESEEDEDPAQEEEEHDGDDDEENEESMQWDCPLERLASRTYTDRQLEPTELDPRCKPNWPLAGYWPVYVGNFRLFKKFDSDNNCSHAVHKYFASKGLPTFMVYRLKDSFFEEYQKRVGFYDMLVYFCNKKDASRAVKWCHRDLYYGHRLNVYCGRTPVMFPTLPHKKFKTYRFKHRKAEDKLETETNLERYLSCYGKILCISKQDFDSVLVQFLSTSGSEILPKDNRVYPFRMTRPFPKQRFVEANIEKELTKEIAENPRFMRMRLVYKLLVSIKHGVIPEMLRSWERAEVDEAVIAEHRRHVNWRNPNNVRDTFKRRHDGFHNDSPPSKSRRELIREAKSLEYQLMRIKNEINEGNPGPPKLPPQKQFIPRAAVQSKDPQPKPKRQLSETQLIRRRIRAARRNLTRHKRPSVNAEKNKPKPEADN